MKTDEISRRTFRTSGKEKRGKNRSVRTGQLSESFHQKIVAGKKKQHFPPRRGGFSSQKMGIRKRGRDRKTGISGPSKKSDSRKRETERVKVWAVLSLGGGKGPKKKGAARFYKESHSKKKGLAPERKKKTGKNDDTSRDKVFLFPKKEPECCPKVGGGGEKKGKEPSSFKEIILSGGENDRGPGGIFQNREPPKGTGVIRGPNRVLEKTVPQRNTLDKLSIFPQRGVEAFEGEGMGPQTGVVLGGRSFPERKKRNKALIFFQPRKGSRGGIGIYQKNEYQVLGYPSLIHLGKRGSIRKSVKGPNPEESQKPPEIYPRGEREPGRKKW